MRIGIDATAVGAEPSTGMGVYGFNLVRNLIEIDNWNQYVIYCRHTVHDQFKGVGERITFKVSPINNRKVAEQFWLPVTTIGDRLDVFHGLCGLPRFAPKTSVLTIHGLSWRIMPEVFTRTQRLYWVHCAEGMMRTAKRLIAVSRWTRNLMHERFGIPAERIDVVHHGVNRNEFPHVGDARVIADMRRRHNLPEQYILFVGSVLPVKNVPVLVEAYQQLIRDERFARLKLVIAGIKGWGYAEAEQAVRDRGLNDRVMFTGKFPANDLPTLYSAAELFVLPSKYEGFGMPLIEAFSCAYRWCQPTPRVCRRSRVTRRCW